jgi:hypothetical protein
VGHDHFRHAIAPPFYPLSTKRSGVCNARSRKVEEKR